MSTIDTFVRSYKFYRDRTLGLLDSIHKLDADPHTVLGWRPGPGRAHIAWQLMHVGITEEIFATERLAPHKQGAWQELWPRFRGGSTPDDNIPTADQIRQTLADSREHLLATLSEYNDSRLTEVPEALKARNWTVQDVLSLIGWHEAHHQGQSHITLNLYKASRAK
jgi:uncharacterized damage-inducible protein DinB